MMERLSFFKTWIISLRLFSLPFIMFPYALGIAVAVYHEGNPPDPALIIIGFIPLLLCHLAGNLQSDVLDFKMGIDKVPHTLSGGIVRGWVSPRKALRVATVLYLVAVMIGIVGIARLGPVAIFFTFIGPGMGISYSAGKKLAIKYGLAGEWFVFAGYGIIVPLFSYFLCTGTISTEPLLFFLPVAFLMGAVKHANNWIASLRPGNPEGRTSASRGGNFFSRYYYYTLVTIPYLLIMAYLIWGDRLGITLPGSIIFIFLSLPVLFLLIILAGQSRQVLTGHHIKALDSSTAMLFSLFSLLLCISFMLG